MSEIAKYQSRAFSLPLNARLARSERKQIVCSLCKVCIWFVCEIVQTFESKKRANDDDEKRSNLQASRMRASARKFAFRAQAEVARL